MTYLNVSVGGSAALMHGGMRQPVMRTLTLPEAFFLLSTDEKGRLADGWTGFGWYGLAGAVLAELALRGRIRMSDERLDVVDATPTGDPTLDEALRIVADRRRPRSPESWTYWLPHEMDDLRRSVGDALAVDGLVGREERRLLGLRFVRYPVRAPGVAQALESRLHAELVEGAPPDARTVGVASILDAVGLLGDHFPRAERRVARAHLRDIASADALGPDAAAAIRVAREATSGAVQATTTVVGG